MSSESHSIDPYAKSLNAKNSLRRLWRALNKQRLRVAGIALLILISTLATVIAPLWLGDATNVIVDGIGAPEGIDWNRLVRILLYVVLAYVVSSLLYFAAGIVIRVVVQNLGYDLREQAQRKIDRLPLSYLDKHQRGDVLSRVTNDIDNITQTLLQTLSQMIQSAYQLIGIIAMMFYISWALALLSLAVMPLGIIGTLWILKHSRPYFSKQWKETGAVSSLVEENFTGLEVVEAYNLQDEFAELFDDANSRLFTASFRGQTFSQLSEPVMNFVTNISFVVVSVIGGLLTLHGSMTIGGIQAFIQYSRQLTGPVQALSSMAALLQSGAASGERVFDFLDTPEIKPDVSTTLEDAAQHAQQRNAGFVDDAHSPENNAHSPMIEHSADRSAAHSSAAVEFQHIRFGYQSDHPVIRDFSLKVDHGQSIAIVGHTGAGKTTLVNLLMRFYDLDAGQILVDGVPTTEFSKDSLRSHIGMVLQDTWLFAGTIEENIAFGRPGATRTEIAEAARATGVDRLVRQLPHGYLTELNEDSAGLSAGEKQLLTIARAYLASPDILILDEATSSVDTRTEMLVQDAMNRLRAGRTSFIIAHRLSTIRNADTIIVMEHGDIVETGKHEDLMARGGAYATLYNSQFLGAKE